MNTKLVVVAFALVALLFGQVSFADGDEKTESKEEKAKES